MAGCKDDFASINTDPSNDPEGTIPFLFTSAMVEMDPFDYKELFYNASKYYLPWTQATADRSGNTDVLNTMSEFREQQQDVIPVKVLVEAIRFKLAHMSEDEAKRYKHIDAMCSAIMVYMGIYGTDQAGSMAFTEAGRVVSYPNDPTAFKPKFETQEELLNLWLVQLDEAIKTFSTAFTDANGGKVGQYPISNQDFIYKGDVAKWKKFTNSLKLKIAVRLLHSNKAKALKIAEEVASSSAGIMDGVNDDFIWNPGSQFYHFGDNVNYGTGTDNLINFLVNNKDPRVRFLFAKNDFNSNIISGFLKAKKPIPFYIDKYIEYGTDADGNKTFKAWKAPGEPWVRYQGVPMDFQAKNNPSLVPAYYTENNFKLKIGDNEKTYTPVSIYQEEMMRGGKSYTYPTLPDQTAIEDNASKAFYAVYLSTAEINFYLAEFKLLGANLPKSADEYFKKGVEMSVIILDKLAGLNQIPYYATSGQAYTTSEETISLRTNEIADLLKQPAYQLTGSKDDQLEKIYVQEYIHFLYSPNDLYITVKRSGYPKKGSSILPRLDFDKTNPNYVIPRRLRLNTVLKSDQMYDIITTAYAAEGFTAGTSDPNILATERIWSDKGAPAYGAGSNY